MKQPGDTTFPAYPWPDEEMIARYGLRHLTPEEQQVFPGWCWLFSKPGSSSRRRPSPACGLGGWSGWPKPTLASITSGCRAAQRC